MAGKENFGGRIYSEEVWQMKKIRNKYYKQIVLALIMVSLCPVIFLGGSIYRLIHEQMDSLYGNLQDSVEKERHHYEVIFQ